MVRRLAFAPLLLAALALAQEEAPAPQGCSPNETLPCVELRRDDKLIIVQQTARDSEGGLFGSRTFDEAAECAAADHTLTTFYAPAPKVVETRLGDTLITANIVLRDQPRGNQDAATLEVFGGSLDLDPETFCPQSVVRAETAEVTLREGRTTVRGVRLLYDNASGDSVMTGSPASPVTLERAAEGDSPALTASAEKLEFNADAPERTFTGGVRITSEARVSEADELVYNDDSGVAVLRGNPARSRKGDEFVEGRVITYYLDSNDVVVVGSVTGELVLDLGGVTEPEPSAPEGAPDGGRSDR